jgi:hypothetical protein
MAFIAPLWFVLLIIVMHRSLMLKFDGCFISNMEREARNDPNYDFFTELTYRTTGKRIASKGSLNIDMILLIIVLVIAVLMHSRRNRNRLSI